MVTREEYAPYHTMAAFIVGECAYNNPNYWLCRKPVTFFGVELQAYDRGAEYAMRLAQEQRT